MEKYIKEYQMQRELYWVELLEVLTEDENLRLRKNDFDQLKRTEIREFFMILSTFEKRMEERLNKLEQEKNKTHG